jgi:hypothetical protein
VNHFDETISRIEGAWPDYQVWIIRRVVGGPLYCARRRDQSAAVLNADDPDDLAVLIGDQAGEAGNQG